MCLSRVTLDTRQLWVWDVGKATYQRLDLPTALTPEQERRSLRRAKVRCPNVTDERPEHYLPYHYVTQAQDPVVIAMVGAPRSGKTHLLAAMIGRIQEEGLRSFGLSVSPLDVGEYERFISTEARPLLEDDAVLRRTNPDVWEFVVGLIVDDIEHEDSPPRAVIFFDVAGEDLATASKVDGLPFFEIVDGVVFVISPDELNSDESDDTFFSVLNLMPHKDEKAAVLVLAKADQCRFEYPVDRWLREEKATLDPSQVWEESRDLYSYIVEEDKGAGYLRPWAEIGRTAIHAVSATGAARGDEGSSRYPRPVRPRRALQPFLTLMAMTGVKKGAEVEKVGD